ncbi:DUF6924 domain-containing protein [Actinoplanes sp. NPDC049265]|uniref:DUF6924 domain-containing protein n=1 Tax=Actinoplanes sp. NPDC049265 TaxID=3363902 RepID=UPI00371B90C0
MNRPAEWTGWQAGGSWLPLGGALMMQSLTSPSGRYTALHSVYEPSLTVRDNATGRYLWVSDSPRSTLISLGPEGDLVAWDHHGNRLWHTGTAWRGVQRLEMRDTGELRLVDASGAAVWSTPAGEGPGGAFTDTAARGSVMRRGETLNGQALTSDDGATVLWHDGRNTRLHTRGGTAGRAWFHDRPTVLALEDDGYLRIRGHGGDVIEQIGGPGTELVVIRGRAELRDEHGTAVWWSAGRTIWRDPVREPAIPQDEALTAWFRALAGEGRGYCVAVGSGSTPGDVLARAGVAATETTWRQLRRSGMPAVAAVAVGPDVLIFSDDPDLPVADLAPTITAVRQHTPGGGYDAEFNRHRNGRLVAQARSDPHRRKGLKIPEVAVAYTEITHELFRTELLFRTTGSVPSAGALAGPLLGGVLPSSAEVPDGAVDEIEIEIDGYDGQSALVVRTDFTADAAWERIHAELRKPWGDGPCEPFTVVDRRHAGLSPGQLVRALRTTTSVFFVADDIAMRGPGHPLLAVTTDWDGAPFAEDEQEFVTRFRLLPDAAVEVSVNLSLGNMSFDEFAGDGTEIVARS